MLFDLCKDFSLFYQDQGITHLAPLSLLSLGPGTALTVVTAHLPPISLRVNQFHAALCRTGKHAPWESSEAVTKLSSCMLWLSVSKARLVQSPMQTFFLALMCPSHCTRSHSGKKLQSLLSAFQLSVKNPSARSGGCDENVHSSFLYFTSYYWQV